MKRRLLIAGLCAAACLAGMACGGLMVASISCRDAIGVLFGRGHLLVLVQGRAFYEADVQRALAELRDAAGNERRLSNEITERNVIISNLVANEIIRSLAAPGTVSGAELGRVVRVYQSQFENEKAWRRALRASGISASSFARALANHLRTRQWIEHQLMHQPATVEELKHYYDEHLEVYSQPVRFRANHLFLAAPAEAPADLIEEKSEAIASLAKRVSHGESLSDLALLSSEDEATKTRGGDLGFFSEYRMPPDFVAAVTKLRVGEISPAIRTRLGFHLVQVTETKSARQMSFEEVREEVVLALENEKRQNALRNLVADLVRRAEFVSPGPGWRSRL